MSPVPTFVQPPGWLEKAGEWFLRSGIQEPEGGVARYYRSDLGRNARVSTEITGYTASALIYLYRRTGREEYLEAARRAALFLCRCAWRADIQAMPFEHPAQAGAPSLAYFFDCGIIVRGLLAVWRIANEREFLETAMECGHSMVRDFECAAGFHPILSLPSKEPLPYEPRWSREPGCYQLKSALAWRTLAAATGDVSWNAHFERAIGSALGNEREFLPGEEDRERVMDRLHAFSYFLEALLASPAPSGLLKSGIERAASLARGIAPQFARSDVWAQLLRVRLHAEAFDLVPLDLPAAQEEASAAAAFQQDSGDPHTSGGFWFGRKGGQTLLFSNPVSTAFCLQALDLWEQRAAGGIRPVLDDLI